MSDYSPAQLKAWKELAEARWPIRLHAATARSLERERIAERRTNGWVITEQGRQYLARVEGRQAGEELDREFPGELRDRLKKTIHWLEFTGRLSLPYRATPIIQCLLMGREPICIGTKGEARVRSEVESAIKIVGDFLEAYSEAVKTGGEVGVTILAEKPNPARARRWQKAQVDASADVDGTVSLSAFRKQRNGGVAA